MGDTLATNLASATDSEGRVALAAGTAEGKLRIWPRTGQAERTMGTLLVAFIHPSAWKVNSANVAVTEL